MADWTLVPCLQTLRAEFNQLAPGRDKASDGSVGDTSHAANSSDHNPDETGNTPSEDADKTNEVHAIDVDHDLRKPGWSMNRCLEIIITRHREGRDDRLQNVIYNRRIWSRSWGWTARAYTGASTHTEHAHLSARYTTAQEGDTSPWGLLEEDDDMPLTNADVDLFLKRDVIPNPYGDAGTNPTISVATALKAGPLADVRTRDLAAAVSLLRAEVATLAGKDFTDEQAIVAGVLAGLDPAAIAAAIPPELARQVADELASRLAG